MSSSVAINPAVYPSPRRDETVIDNFHGTKISDPYRYMEDPDGKETKEFVKGLNDISEPFIKQAPNRDDMKKKLTEMWNFEKYTVTSKRGDYYYYQHNSGLQNQFVLYRQKKLDDKGEVFFDANKLSDDGTTSIRMQKFSEDGSIFAYGISEKGSDWTTLKFRKADGTDLSDAIPNVKHSGLAWSGDNSGVFYSKYPGYKSASVGTSVEKQEFHSLYFHKLGTSAAEDVLVYDKRDDPNYMIGATVEDGHLLVIDVARGCDPYSMLFVFDLKKVDYKKLVYQEAASRLVDIIYNATSRLVDVIYSATGRLVDIIYKMTGKIEPVPIFDKLDAKYDYIDHDEKSLLIQTNKDAPMFKLIRVLLEDPSKVEVIVPEEPKKKLDWAAPLIGGRLLVSYLEDVKGVLYVHEASSGKQLYQIPTGIGTISGTFARKDCNEMFYSFESQIEPTSIYHLDFTDLPIDKMPEPKLRRKTQLKGIDTSKFAVKQVFFSSKDGTKVPMFIISKKNIELNGNNPTVLSGYGGFNIADTPYFGISRLLFINNFNGIVATANLRGGSEYGESWHTDGMREKKQNVFDDFVAAAEYLIKEKYTKPAKLAIQGGSNGGLLMGACSQQRPELFGAVINRVGVLDMLRFHKFTIGGAWIPEYGNPEVAGDFEFIYKYSPLHNIKFPAGGQWPSTLLMTADHDDRVVPSHTLKYAAQLFHMAKQHKGQEKPLLARIEVKAGHGAGKPTSKIIGENVDIYCFLQRVLDLKWEN